MPRYIHKPGPVGLMSRSGTLTYEAVWQLTNWGWGSRRAWGWAANPIVGTSFIDCLKLFQADPQTEAILMMGESAGMRRAGGGIIRQNVTKPVAASLPGGRPLRASGWAMRGRSFRVAAAQPAEKGHRARGGRRGGCRKPGRHGHGDAAGDRRADAAS